MNHLFQLKNLSAILLIAMCSYSANGFAETQGKKKTKVAQQQTVKEDYGNTVTLVTSGSGSNEDEATRNALRNAIEQAFGTFVSSNTTVVNDELVSDAIASVSSGNVLGYEQISCFDTNDGCVVSVKAVVSIGGLVSFAQNKGMETELAGNTFLQNKRLAKLNKENEMKALTNLVDQLFIFLSQAYDYTVDVGQPSGDGVYSVLVTINATPNNNMNSFWDIIDKTLSSLSMSPSESQNYQSLGMKTYQYCYGPEFERFKIDTKQNLVGTKSRYILRTNIGRVAYGRVLTDKETEFNLLQMIENVEKMGKYCYEIYDNIGTVITPTIEEGANKVGRSIDGFKLGPVGDAKTFSIVLMPTGNGGARFNIPSNARLNSFQLIYQEDQLSKLQKVSVRPHGIQFSK
ncbi:hypothetical protein [Prevotella sp. P4-98]|uniref:hypothetical protein n=1 Tax=Prevotella sp. P4-98 TaxID=2024219 RepID=UPI000B95EFB4|nr:hypothetical protein [Prevotella sp. P4-98]